MSSTLPVATKTQNVLRITTKMPLIDSWHFVAAQTPDGLKLALKSFAD